MTNKPRGTLYTGSTSNLVLRVEQHKSGTGSSFTKQYKLNRLVWFEEFEDFDTAISQERRIKKWRRDWKIELIEKANPDWIDLRPY